MNKKRLSVVMAGAMLASSVSPVLAAEVTKTETSADNLGLLIQNVREKLNSKKFEDVVRNKELRGKSIYFVKVDGETKTLDADSTQTQFQTVLGNLKPGQKVEIWTKAHVIETVDGVDKYYAYKEVAPTYTSTTLEAALQKLTGNTTTGSAQTATGNYTNVVKTAELNVEKTKLTITFDNDTATWLPNTLVLEEGAEVLDLEKYIDRDTKDEVKVDGAIVATKFDVFPKAVKDKVAVTDGKEKVEEITITSGGNNVSVDDIYDGVMLTTKGHDFFSAIKEAETLRGTTRSLKGNAKGGTATITNKSDIADAIVEIDGKYSFSITVAGGNGVTEAAIFTVVGTNEKATERMAEWILAGQAKVDILAGSNRYATVVQIAKEYAGLTDAVASSGTNTGKANIVLVNGESLVDGLAAAPLAAAKTNNVQLAGELSASEHAAPVLLTASDKLPKETRAYLKDVIGKLAINNVKAATIHIVGGESVVSKGIERELKSLGFSVERYGGDNREETSLEVADAIGTTTEAFVVGAEGEADAMSIAAIAANKADVKPIIVAKKGGITEDALYELRDVDVTIIGGENAISKAKEEEIGLEADSVSRIADKNRQETNSKIIAKYYTKSFGNAKNVVVAKDGQHNKMELVDALAAANFASEKQAPIVLATNKLSDEQINALELNAGSTAEALYQVGIGVDKDNVVKVIAQRLGLAN